MEIVTNRTIAISVAISAGILRTGTPSHLDSACPVNKSRSSRGNVPFGHSQSVWVYTNRVWTLDGPIRANRFADSRESP